MHSIGRAQGPSNKVEKGPEMMNMNSGYAGWSMSVRAVEAYESGEMPKSKWTKKAMLAALAEWANDNNRVLNQEVATIKKDELFNTMFICTSWHHTSKFCNPTDFYGVDEWAALDHSTPMTVEQIAKRDRMEQERFERMQAEQMLAQQAAAERERKRVEYDAAWWCAEAVRCAAWERENGVGYQTLAGYVLRHPEAGWRVAKTGALMFRIRPGYEFNTGASDFNKRVYENVRELHISSDFAAEAATMRAKLEV